MDNTIYCLFIPVIGIVLPGIFAILCLRILGR